MSGVLKIAAKMKLLSQLCAECRLLSTAVMRKRVCHQLLFCICENTHGLTAVLDDARVS